MTRAEFFASMRRVSCALDESRPRLPWEALLSCFLVVVVSAWPPHRHPWIDSIAEMVAGLFTGILWRRFRADRRSWQKARADVAQFVIEASGKPQRDDRTWN